jgi:hypothetical protein
MAGPHEELEHAEHVEHAGHSNKKIAMLIAVLALGLAISEMFGKSAQTNAITDNITASDTWAFFQAKTIRQTTLRTAAQALELQLASIEDEPQKAAMTKQITDWQKTVARYESEPETNEGRKELTVRAQMAEHARDLALAKYHQYEYASAAYQIGIVLAATSVISGMLTLAYGAGGLGLIGLAFTILGTFVPNALHLLSAGGGH